MSESAQWALRVLLPNLGLVEVPCPDPQTYVHIHGRYGELRTELLLPLCAGTMTIDDQVIHLNDDHEWTREEIADWLDTLDVDLRFRAA